jgi:hypothetical protein
MKLMCCFNLSFHDTFSKDFCPLWFLTTNIICVVLPFTVHFSVMQKHETDEWQVAHFVGRQVSDKVITLPGVFLHIWDAQFNKACAFRALHTKTNVYFSSCCRDFPQDSYLGHYTCSLQTL